jgi:platelet-activating factor acetylhydrolase IB subunit alpha
VAKLTTKQKI